jgi:hypothetical protein
MNVHEIFYLFMYFGGALSIAKCHRCDVLQDRHFDRTVATIQQRH